ncbi:MAG: hypothetical protein ACOCZM_01405 [Bacillota bacterium]
MKFAIYIFVIFLSIFLLTGTVAAASLEGVEYSVYTNLDTIESLELGVLYAFDGINSLQTFLNYGEEEFKFSGAWMVNSLRADNYTFRLGVGTAFGSPAGGVGKAVAFSGYTDSVGTIRTFYNVNYYFNNNTWVYSVDGGVPVYDRTYLTFGLGNTYWQEDKTRIRAGINIKI